MKRLYVKRGEIKLNKEKFSCFVMSEDFNWFLMIRIKDETKVIDEPILIGDLISEPSDYISTAVDDNWEPMVVYEFVGSSKAIVNLKIKNLENVIENVCEMLEEEIKEF